MISASVTHTFSVPQATQIALWHSLDSGRLKSHTCSFGYTSRHEGSAPIDLFLSPNIVFFVLVVQYFHAERRHFALIARLCRRYIREVTGNNSSLHAQLLLGYGFSQSKDVLLCTCSQFVIVQRTRSHFRRSVPGWPPDNVLDNRQHQVE